MKNLRILTKVLAAFVMLFAFAKADTLLSDVPKVASAKCQEVIKQTSAEKIPEWRSSYSLTQDSMLYSAPSESCALQPAKLRGKKSAQIPIQALKSGDKVDAIAKADGFLLVRYSMQDAKGNTHLITGYIKQENARLSVFKLDVYFTLMCMIVVLLLGRFIIARLRILQDYNIPEPIVGGVIVAVFFLCAYQFLGLQFSFDSSLKNPLMLAFFSSIGLSADFASLKKGGKMLGIFLIVVAGLLLIQNFIGVGVSYAMGANPLVGMLGSSITMSGGHGTGAAWADVFKNAPYNFSAATEVAMACATFGLVMGGLIGGPTARYLIKKHNLKIPSSGGSERTSGFEAPAKERLITPISFIESLALVIVCLLAGDLLGGFVKGLFPAFNLPTFVYCLFVGVVLRNALSATNIHHVFDREVSVLGNVSLSLFLAFAMMTLNLWELVSLALPIMVILSAQVVCMVLYAVFVTFRFCGRDYDAAVLAAGHCGFGLGATPTAMVNMQAVTSHYGPSHVAFIIVPLVGAFFIDLINVVVIQGMLQLLPF